MIETALSSCPLNVQEISPLKKRKLQKVSAFKYVLYVFLITSPLCKIPEYSFFAHDSLYILRIKFTGFSLSVIENVSKSNRTLSL